MDHDSATLAGAPGASGDALDEEEFEAVYEHYGISDATMRSHSQP